MDPNDGQIGKRKWSFLKSLSKRVPRRGDTKRANEIAVKENQNLPIFQLPDELLIKIIESVPIAQWPSLELVSRRFQTIVHGLWGQVREIRLDEFVLKEKNPYKVVEAALRKFIIRAPNVAFIGGFSEYFDLHTSISKSIIRVLSMFQHLETIDFSGERIITEITFAAFLESSASRQSWKHLDIVGGIHGENEVPVAVASKNKEPLNLEYFKIIMETFYIFDRFLQPIEWSGLKQLAVVGRIDSAKDALSIIHQCTHLTHLEIDLSDYECGNRNGQPSCAEFMQGIADLEDLSVLKIWDCKSLGNAFSGALQVLIQDLARRGITDFALVPVSCNDQIVDAIIDHLPRLRSLELGVEECTTTSLVRLTKRMRELETLKLRYLGSMDSTIVRAIGANMTNLQCLHLGYLKINSEDLTTLADLRKLKELRFTGFGTYTQDTDCGTIETWARLGFGPCLERMELGLDRILDGISPKTMGDFLKNMPRLRRMQLWEVTDPILYSIVESCPNLIELNLLGESTITSAAIQNVIDRCTQLKCLKGDHHNYYEWFESVTVGKYRKITSESTFKEEWEE